MDTDWDEIYTLVEKMENNLADIDVFYIPQARTGKDDGLAEIRWLISDVDYELRRLISYVKAQKEAGNG